MTTKEDLRRAIGAADELDPAAVAAEVSLLTGARLKSQNYEGTGSRSAEHGLPLFDRLDKQTIGRDKAYRSKIQRAANLLEQALFIQRQILERFCDENGVPTEEAQKLAAEDAGPQAENCANCKRVVERTAADKLLAGRCRNCHDYLKKHGAERPKELWVAA